MHGDVGTGTTLVMDLFAAAVVADAQAGAGGSAPVQACSPVPTACSEPP
jgi:hypothetical protein